MANKNITFTMPVTDKEFEEAIPNIPAKFYDKFETYRQLSIVHEIMNSKGSSFYEKAYNCMAEWSWDNNKTIRYKIKHR